MKWDKNQNDQKNLKLGEIKKSDQIQTDEKN